LVLGVVLTQRIAVIGAGLAGLSCARVLRRAGCYVEVFEQERIIGGRMAGTRLGGVAFDHGCPYVAAKSQRFKSYLDEIAGNGYAARWNAKSSQGEEGGGQLQPWYVGTPGMGSIVRPLAESVRINAGRKVHTLQRVDKSWHIWFEDQTSAGPFAAVAVCVPAPEARLLLGQVDKLSDALQKVRMSPCWSLMVRIEERVLPDQDVFSDMSQVIRWVARNNSKPGRSARGEHIVLHASPAWSRETEDAEPEMVAEELWGEVSHVLSLPPVRPAQMLAHLWRNGIVETSLGETYLFSREQMVGLAGDWCLGRLGEHAFESGALLGKAIVDTFQ
jgi:renalase